MLSGRPGVWRAASLGLLGVLSCITPVRAQSDGESYELQRLQLYLGSAGLSIDPLPEGKTIRRLRFVRREVLERDDLLIPVLLPRFATTWPNWFHHLTEETTIRQEVLLREGEPFRSALAEESMRNLRNLPVIALARIAAVRTEDPERVDVVVFTRDLWSLRFEQAFSGAGESFDLGLQLVERNFLGRNKALGARFALAPDRYSFGQTYVDPRLFGQELRLTEAFDLIFNRASGSPEGAVGTLRFGRPFYTLAQRFSFELLASLSDFVSRNLQNGRLTGFATRAGPEHGGACTPGSADCIARVWDESRLRVELAASHRVGMRYTQTFTSGAGVSDRHVNANAETRLTAAQARVFREEVLPRVRRDVYPFVRYRLSLPRFAVFTNLGTFGQSESVQLGPHLDSSVALPLRLLGSSGDGLQVSGKVGYTWAAGDALVDALATGTSRLDRGDVVDQKAVLQLRAASPSWRWSLGRFVLRAVWEVRHNDSQNTPITLGADNGLRGYAAQALYGTGASRVLWNVEYRTRPWVLQSIHVGLVGFYDLGSVYRTLSRARVYQGAGAGVRVLLPQFNRTVFRLDVGAPIGRSGFSVLLSYGGDQVVPLTPAEDLLAEAGVGLNSEAAAK